MGIGKIGELGHQPIGAQTLCHGDAHDIIGARTTGHVEATGGLAKMPHLARNRYEFGPVLVHPRTLDATHDQRPAELVFEAVDLRPYGVE